MFRLVRLRQTDSNAGLRLKKIHAVEFLGEPQYGGGRPVPPMDVWRALAPYQRSRLPTTVTRSEERIWRFYAGLSDFEKSLQFDPAGNLDDLAQLRSLDSEK